MENLIILVSVLFSSIISGVFGMAGGMILIGVFSSIFPLSQAMIIHGFAQFIANIFRAILSREGIVFKFIPFFSIGVIVGLISLKYISYSPTKETLYLILGMTPLLFLFILKSFNLKIENKKNAVLSGLISTVLQIVSGSTGPALDLFFIKNNLNKTQVIATKAIVQSIGHLTKIIYFLPFIFSQNNTIKIKSSTLIIILIFSITGTIIGKYILTKFPETKFKKYSLILILTISVIYIFKGIILIYRKSH